MEQQNNPDKFPSNSYIKSGPEGEAEKKTEAVATGRMIKSKKSLGGKIAETFFATDAKHALDYVVGDILIPKTIDVIVDTIYGWINTLFYGRGARNNSDYRDGGGRYINYSKISDSKPRSRRDSDDDEPKAKYKRVLQTICFRSREDANMVLDKMLGDLCEYGVVSVQKYYNYSNMPSEYTHSRYGWENLNGVAVVHTRDGWIVDLPDPKVID